MADGPTAASPASPSQVHRALRHDSAPAHVSGQARYIDDLPEPPGLLHLAFGLSEQPHARVLRLDLAPVRAASGVVAVFAAADIPGENNVAPVAHDDPLFAEDTVLYHGQPLFVVAADSHAAARRAARLARVEYAPLPALLSIA
ncbi:xanthine dehydrogenase molybdopterin binding subunit, partial [Xanthomonas campestris pv. cannae]|nr:xanthine dehydrogenase molybdopterin binding subunit [Xanthomonas campestris pv. cannae]